MKNVRGYIFSRPFMGERVPQHVQNLVIRDYCARAELNFLLSATEYAMDHCHLVLEQVLDELTGVDGVVAYSVFQLPEDGLRRRRLYDQIVSTGKALHFAVEGLSARTAQECERIETLWKVRLTLPHCGHSGHVNG
jgi:sporadic carbohydrate cluster protein (TIGR04323 family)